MKMLDQNFIFVAAIITSIGGIGYLLDTLRGRAKPHRVSFFLWAVGPSIAFAAELKQGVGLIALMTLTQGVIPFLIFIASFVNKKASWKITRFDILCGFLSVLGIFFWAVTKVGNVAILFAIVGDTFASIPTLKKSFFHPESEVAWPYFAGVIGMAITLFTIKSWTFENYAFIVYIFIMNLILTSLIKFKVGEKVMLKMA